MISEPVFEHPGSLLSLMQRFEARRDAQERVPALELAMIIEKHSGRALPAAFSDYLTKHFRGEIKGARGRKLQSDATKAFRFGPASEIYYRALPIFAYLAKRRKRPGSKARSTKSVSNPQNGPRTPSAQALDYAVMKSLEEGECDLRMISRKSLANAFSERQRMSEAWEFPDDDDPNRHPTDES
jgi:hypothetical protein